MAMTVNGVPESVPWEIVRDFLESIGINLNYVPRSDETVKIGFDSIECQVYASDPDGNYYLNRAGDGAAIHRVQIRVTHDADVLV